MEPPRLNYGTLDAANERARVAWVGFIFAMIVIMSLMMILVVVVVGLVAVLGGGRL